MSKLVIDYKTLEQDTLVLAERLAKSGLIGPSLQVVCISRGGLFVGGLLSYALNLKNIHCVSIESYEEDKAGTNHNIVCRTPFLPAADKNFDYLFIDDLNDTSQTYQYVKNKCDELGLIQYFATTYHKVRNNNLLPDYYGREVDSDSWIVFPWDNLGD